MPLIDLPARAVLKLSGQTDIAWAVFDPDWYRERHPACPADPDAALAFYLDHGQGSGHSPNRYFDEAWHLCAYPGIAALVQDGSFASAFDSYCRDGSDRSPHWLFEELSYRRHYPDLTDAAMQNGGLVNGYDHYLRHGSREARIGHPMFDSALYVAQFDPADRAAVEAEGPFPHYLRRIDSGQPELRTTLYFSPDWYLERYPDVAEAIARGDWLCALHHYLCNTDPTRFDPLPDFSEAYYLARYPDLVPVIEAGSFRNGYIHFMRHGVREFRSPSEPIDLGYYVTIETVRRDLEEGLAADAFAHWLSIGRARKLDPAPPVEERITETQAKTLFRRKADMLRPLFGRATLRFVPDGPAELSVIVVLHNRFALTMMALASLRSNYAGNLVLILVDSGSSDETRSIERYVEGATVIRFDDNIGFLLGCNAALQAVTTDAVLLLNNDVELGHAAVATALRRLHSDARIGAVGGKVVRTHGLLQEAGNIVWRDGTTKGYLRDESPLMPEANFVRDVDFCSGVFLMLRTDVLRALDGFDEAFAPAYYEDADLCVRIVLSGFRVVYDPSVLIHHHEYGSATSVRASEAEIGFRRQIFVRKHAAWLETRMEPSGPAQVCARMSEPGKRVLFIEDQVPLRSIGSGFVRSNDILQTMAALGYAVTVFPVLPLRFDLAAVYADMPDTVEVMHDRSLEQLQEFLLLRTGYFDVIWVGRTHNIGRIQPMLQRLAREQTLPPVILDTEAIASVRDAQVAADKGSTFDLLTAVRQEFAAALDCFSVIAVNDLEAQLLRDAGFSDPAVLGHMRRLQPTPRPFARRNGMLFVGAIHRMDSPNYDSLSWFVDDVLPLVERELGWETRLTVVGYRDADVALDRFADHPRVTLRGALDDIMPLYDSHRVFVAPTRIAAGTPYKIQEAASFGLPVVATEVLRRQLGWTSGQELLAADASDPAAFAAAIVRLYRDGNLWERMREAALRDLAVNASAESYAATIQTILGRALMTEPPRDNTGPSRRMMESETKLGRSK